MKTWVRSLAGSQLPFSPQILTCMLQNVFMKLPRGSAHGCKFIVHSFSLRALFGKSILDNAVHGSSSEDGAKEEIKKFFGEVEFAPSGMLKKEGGEEGRGEGEEEGGAGEQGTTGV